MRAVLDPNVLIASLVSRGGAPARIVSQWFAGAFELIVSEALLSELERALAYPKVRARVSEDEAAEFTALLREGATLASDPPTPPQRSADSNDDYLLALAESQQARLVSGDRHLLVLQADLPVFTPREFLDVLDAEDDAP